MNPFFLQDFINKFETWEQNIIHTIVGKFKGFFSPILNIQLIYIKKTIVKEYLVHGVKLFNLLQLIL